ncbi:MAG TPA: J domain-containing protein [Saprospiraceae bacterium]|nr:J domain-containing protein [Saprospiraceae bacterium]
MTTPFTEQEVADIQEFFGQRPENLGTEEFRKALRDLRARYHPDNFERFGDEVVRQLATERFQRIQRLAEKIEAWKNGPLAPPPAPPRQPAAQPWQHPQARFAYQEMKIEIRTRDKDLKFRLFGTFYRWLLNGDRFKIPGTQAFIISDESYMGHQIGFVESIRFYLTFEEKDSIVDIVTWLHGRVADSADTLFIEGEVVPLQPDDMELAIRRRSYRGLPADAQSAP